MGSKETLDMISFNQARNSIDRKLGELPLSRGPAELYDPISYIISIGGKRLRPVMLLMSCNLFIDEYEKAIEPALGIELFHNFTLLHDDIMDESVVRRNHPTVHNKWNKNIAILSGDAMSIMSYDMISRCDDGVLKAVLRLFNKTALQVCEGQQMDMNYEISDSITTSQYLTMIELKTAVLIAASLGIGALIGGAKKEDADEMYQFGKNIGMAFQIRDDYLDVYGDPDVFGKRIGQDILSNKKTYLLTRSLELTGTDTKKDLLKWLSDTGSDPMEKISGVTGVYNRLGMNLIAEKAMNEYYQLALANLVQVRVHDDRKQKLRELVDFMLHRDS